ncbi:MAG: DUF4369 domain-containing protein [Bacteroidales bacterium]|nr:DUF4369 domain-containing protein [Bacteroidales bacterium]
MKNKLEWHRFSVIILLLAALTASCNRDGFTISGTLDGGAGHTLWLEEIAPEGPIFIDSIPVDRNGHFKYSYTPPYRSLYNLHTTEDNYIVTLPDRGEHLEVSGRWDNLSLTYKINGSPESQLLWQLQQYTNDGSSLLRGLVDTLGRYEAMLLADQIDEAVLDSVKTITDSLYHVAFLEQQEYIDRFIDENRGSLATLIALYKPFNNRLIIDTRSPVSIDYYDMVLEGLQETLPDNPHTLRFKNTTEHLRSALARQSEQ